MDCQHKAFHSEVIVARFKDSGRFLAEVTIRCSQCGTPFQFLGLEPGVDTGGARVSIDGLEARIAICPQGTVPNPLQRLAYNIKRFDG